MKRYGLILLSLLLLTGLVACNNRDGVVQKKPAEATPTTTLPESVRPDEGTTAEAEQATSVATETPTEAPTEAEVEAEPAAEAEAKATTAAPAPELERVFSEAKSLIDELLKQIAEGTLTADPNLFEDDAFEDYSPEALHGASPTVHEILWAEAFLELRLKDGTYVTLDIELEDGRWVVEEIEATGEFFERDGKVQLEEQGHGQQKKWHFRNLSGLPATQFANEGEYIDLPSQGKRVLVLKRWEDDEQFKSVIKLLELNGSIVPAEIMYKKQQSVLNEQSISENFGIYFYPGEDSVWLNRLAEILGLD